MPRSSCPQACSPGCAEGARPHSSGTVDRVVWGSHEAAILRVAELNMSPAFPHVITRPVLEGPLVRHLPPRKGSELKCLPRVFHQQCPESVCTRRQAQIGCRCCLRPPALTCLLLSTGIMWDAPNEWDSFTQTGASCRRQGPQLTTADGPARLVCPHLLRTPRSR